ncbi:MAG: hypothetical protein JXQ75_11525 [Phycisphaerae bacterium]|nr:hypothetical protein [Phycisphaerae bacterium]
MAGFTHWQRLGRTVRKGEKAIRIISPCPIRRVPSDEEEQVRVFFKTACVFDVSQTDGKPLPTAEVPEVQADAEDLLAALERVASDRGIAVRYRSMEEGAFGVSKGGEVEIATGHSTGQQSKSLVHELAHEAMHRQQEANSHFGIGRQTAELEAEAVAYVVCRHFNLDVELRASRYIAVWGGDGKTLAASLGRISATAQHLIEASRKHLDTTAAHRTGRGALGNIAASAARHHPVAAPVVALDYNARESASVPTDGLHQQGARHGPESTQHDPVPISEAEEDLAGRPDSRRAVCRI